MDQSEHDVSEHERVEFLVFLLDELNQVVEGLFAVFERSLLDLVEIERRLKKNVDRVLMVYLHKNGVISNKIKI